MLFTLTLGGVITVATTGIALVGYYPFKVWDYIVNKLKGNK
jgi:hypothetical protein